MTEPPKAEILDSYFEHRVEFAAPIFAVWTVPNPLVNSLYSSFVGESAAEVYAAIAGYPGTPLVSQVEPEEGIHFAGW